MDPVPQEIAQQSPVPVVPPPPPPKKNNLPLWILFAVLLLGSGWGLYLNAQDQGWLPSNPTPTPSPSITPDESLASQDKLYMDSESRYTFSYPSIWKVIQEVPDDFLYRDPSLKSDWQSYFNTPEGLNWWLDGKMFTQGCRGPILQNSDDLRQLIVFEVVPAESDGAFCWSNGHFFEENKWKIAENYMYPIAQDNSGKLTVPEWKGDFFKFEVLEESSSHKAFAGLANRETYTPKGEETLQKISSTFTFTGAGTLDATITRGPIKPVCREGETCDAPYANQLIDIFSQSDNRLVKSVTTDTNGKLSVDLPAANYVITPREKVGFGRVLDNSFTIQTGKTVSLTVRLDTGIRKDL